MRAAKVILAIIIVVLTLAIPPAFASDTISKTFCWQYGRNNYSIQIEIPVEELDFDKNFAYDVNMFYGKILLGQNLPEVPDTLKPYYNLELAKQGNFTPWTDDLFGNAVIETLAQGLLKIAQERHYSKYYTADMTLHFVGSAIPYKETFTPHMPLQTLVEGGDCKNKSVLLASLLKKMGYRVALLTYPPDDMGYGHTAVGIALDDSDLPLGFQGSYYSYDKTKYFYAETTTPGWSIGQLSDPAKEHPAYIYPIN